MKGKQWSCVAMQVDTLYLIYTGGGRIMPPYPPIRQHLRSDIKLMAFFKLTKKSLQIHSSQNGHLDLSR